MSYCIVCYWLSFYQTLSCILNLFENFSQAERPRIAGLFHYGFLFYDLHCDAKLDVKSNKCLYYIYSQNP